MYLLVGLIFTGITLFLAKKGINNLWAIHVFTLVEYIILLVLLSRWTQYIIAKKIFYTLIILFITLWIFSKFTFESLKLVDTWTSSISCTVLTISFAYMILEMVSSIEILIIKDYRFWIIVGFLFYFSTSLILYGLSNQILGWGFESISDIISKGLIIIGLLVAWKM